MKIIFQSHQVEDVKLSSIQHASFSALSPCLLVFTACHPGIHQCFSWPVFTPVSTRHVKNTSAMTRAEQSHHPLELSPSESKCTITFWKGITSSFGERWTCLTAALKKLQPTLQSGKCLYHAMDSSCLMVGNERQRWASVVGSHGSGLLTENVGINRKTLYIRLLSSRKKSQMRRSTVRRTSPRQRLLSVRPWPRWWLIFSQNDLHLKCNFLKCSMN